ncbi:hypothetical protein PR202_gb28262 [Eleusine coracana subsp. coracana]|uniref:Structural maintenance of chromosomes protein 5 n=1 Tax=Eleusine coracana subsp. coracana TaxID=191504 RepID=A0AAV5FVX2_ELECO|nr:hypothetical protein PR202_gb28262 [Eleusine coracana subsp. coracana]
MAAARAAKRAKIERAAAPQRGEDDYVPGNIVEIELCNFMTYDRLVCRPGPRLNLVVGPNGSGKSSLVCAIALGLAGDPKILGRASNVGAFVKRGEVSGHVKITLRGDTPDDKICITRKIDNENKSEWLLNGATVPKKEVIDVIKKFNIQVNNLTQFLPQDRVSEFAKLTPIQLLEETEKAVGDPNLPVQHHNLVNTSKELKALEVALKQKEQTLNNLKALNAEQEKDVERVRLRDKLLKKAELMKKKLPWLKFDKLKKEFVEVILEKEKTAKMKMEEAAKIFEDSKQPIEYVPCFHKASNIHFFLYILVLKKGKAAHVSKLKKITNQMNQNMSNCRNAIDEEQQLSAELKSTFDDIEELKKQEKSRQQRILKAKEDFAAAKRELEDLQPYELPRDEMVRLFLLAIVELTDKIARVCLDINHLNDEKISTESKLDREKESMTMCSKRLKDMESKNNRLLEALRGGCDKIIDAYNWVQDNKANFRREVYGPVLLESFITLDASDRDVLVRKMKHYAIPILNHTGERGMRREPFNITPEMRQIGISSRLDQVFEAPAAVKDVLISQAGLDSSYIGTDETHRRADAVPKLGISDFWTPDNHYRWSRSRYGGHMSAFVDAVNPPRYFKFDLDVSGMESLRVQKEKHMANIKDFRRRKLEDIYKEEDVESIKKKLDQNLLVEAVALKWSYTEKNMASIEFDAKILEMENGVKKLENDALIAAREYEDRKRITQEHKKQLSNAKQYAESIAMITKDLEKEFREHSFIDAFQMPSTIEELEAAIQDTESEANSMLFLSQNVLLEYQNRQREVQ